MFESSWSKEDAVIAMVSYPCIRDVQFDFLSKGSIKIVKVIEPSNCSSSSMCDFEELCWFLLSYSSKTCLYFFCYVIIQKTRTLDGHLRLFPAVGEFWTWKFEKGVKFDELLIACGRHYWGSLRCMKVRELKLLTKPRIKQVCIRYYISHLNNPSSPLVLFRLLSTELLEGDFYTCAQYQKRH